MTEGEALLLENAAHAQSAPMRRRLGINEINWKSVLESVMRSHTADFFGADQAIRNFFGRLVSPFNVYWFLQRKLSGTDAKIAEALLETSSADSLVLTHQRQFTLWPTQMHYSQEVTLSALPNSEEIQCEASIEIRILGIQLKLRSAYTVLFIHAIASAVAAICLFFALVLLLYGFVSFLDLLAQPLPTVRKAAEQAPIGIPLLCFLVGVAGLCGRGVSHLIHLVLALVRNLRNWT